MYYYNIFQLFSKQSWTPSDLSNQAFWYNGDTGVTDDGSGRASAWADQFGNYNLSASFGGTFRPLIETSALNGHTAVYSDGNYNPMQSAGNFASFTNLTVWLVGLQEAGEDVDAAFIDSGLLSSGNNGFGIRRTGSTQFVIGGSLGAGAPSLAISNSTYYVIRIRQDGSASYLSINNGTESVYSPNDFTANPQKITLFSRPDLAIGAKKKILEIVGITKNADSADLANMETYLHNKYNIY